MKWQNDYLPRKLKRLFKSNWVTLISSTMSPRPLAWKIFALRGICSLDGLYKITHFRFRCIYHISISSRLKHACLRSGNASHWSLSCVNIMHVGRTIRGFVFFSIDKYLQCSRIGWIDLNRSTLRNLFGLECLQVALRGFEYRRAWGEAAAGGGYAVDEDWGWSYSLWHHWICDRKSTTKPGKVQTRKDLE